MIVKKYIPILIADDDDDDKVMLKEAFKLNKLENPLYFVSDGDQLLDFLNHTGTFQDATLSPRPGLILLDLNMPKKDGRQALREIKSNDRLKDIPVVVLTSSRSETDLIQSHELKVHGFLQKPVEFNNFIATVKSLDNTLIDVAEKND